MDDHAGIVQPDEIVWFTLDDQSRPCVSVNDPNNFFPVTCLRYTGDRALVSTRELVDLNMDNRRPAAGHFVHTRIPRRAAL